LAAARKESGKWANTHLVFWPFVVVDLGIPRVSCASFDDWLPKSKLGDMSHDLFISERKDPSPGRQFLGDLKEITQEHADRVLGLWASRQFATRLHHARDAAPE
jgi:hypothetical protein